MAHEVAKGMAYLEGNGCIHRDLAVRNVLLDADLKCKVADFGFARMVDDGVYSAAENARCPIRWSVQFKFKNKHCVCVGENFARCPTRWWVGILFIYFIVCCFPFRVMGLFFLLGC